MRKHAVVGSIAFFFLAPGTVAFLLPWLIAQQWPGDPLWPDAAWTRVLGVGIGAAGLAVLIECFARFALKGLGTPAPMAPTEHLIVSGLYRHVRNPMYVAVVAIILGWALWSGSVAILVYAALVWLGFTTFVLVYEEPTLRATFGKQYETYCSNVGRWIPRLSPWTPQGWSGV